MPTPAANNIQTQDTNPNSGTESFPPSLIFPNGETIKKKMINVMADIDNVNKVPNQSTTKSIALVRKEDFSGKINTKVEKKIAKPELIANTGKFISSPRIWVLALPFLSDIEVLGKFNFLSV